MILDLIVLLSLHITVQRQYMGYTNIIASKKIQSSHYFWWGYYRMHLMMRLMLRHWN